MAKMLGNESAESAMNAAPAVTGIGAGLNPNDPAANERIQGIMKMRGMDYLQAGIGGAAAGSQAGQGAANPLSAFVQGMAAGLQAPAQIYAQKQAQVKSVIGATPFRITHPEIAKTPGYDILAGLPTDLALEVIKTAASDGIKAHITGQEARRTQKEMFDMQEHRKIAEEKFLQPEKKIEVATKFNASPVVQDFNKIDKEYKTIKSMPNDIPGHTAILAKYVQMLSPTARLNESTMQLSDPSGVIDQFTKGMIMKVRGKGLMGPEERAKIENVASILHSNSELKYNQFKNAYLNTYKDTDMDFSLLGIEPQTFTKDGQTIKGYLIGGKIWPIQQ